MAGALGAALILAAAALGVRTSQRYATARVTRLPIREFTNAEYPEDPARRSVQYGNYDGRTLVLTQRDATHFDFRFEPLHAHIATIVVRDVDVSLMTPSLPVWTRTDTGLRRIGLTDRQWNRQEVRFARDAHVEISGGDGWETANLSAVDLAKNCLNAGLWEVLLFVKEGGSPALYYHGWFTFPLGQYKRLFERNTGLPYWRHWYYLEHWFDPDGMIVHLEKLRRVVRERDVPATFDLSERVLAAGEQVRKRRTVLTEDLLTWGDFYDGRPVTFASFIPPGRYAVDHPRPTEYWRMDRFRKAILRNVVSPATDRPLAELELVFASSRQAGLVRFIVSGVDLAALPQLPVAQYPHGLYMPMGIGVPPFLQSYADLQRTPPDRSAYFSVLLDADGRWIDHHRVGIDGPVLHRDANDPSLLHVYLLSYERHTVIAHLRIPTH